MPHLVLGCLAVTAVVAATFLPFASGGYDPLTVPVSMVAWALGRVGLLLVPVGGIWLLASLQGNSRVRRFGWLRRITLAVCFVISLAMVFIAFASSGSILFALAAGLVAGLLDFRLVRHMQGVQAGMPLSRSTAVGLTVAPLVVLATQSVLIGPITQQARNRAIANSEPLIVEIERYRSRNGAYPQSLFSIWGDYKPSVMGIERYHYEPMGDSYNVIFKEPSLPFGTRCFVVYSPRDKQRVTVHEQDRLLLDEAGLNADNASNTIVRPLPQAHWKVLLFLS